MTEPSATSRNRARGPFIGHPGHGGGNLHSSPIGFRTHGQVNIRRISVW